MIPCGKCVKQSGREVLAMGFIKEDDISEPNKLVGWLSEAEPEGKEIHRGWEQH